MAEQKKKTAAGETSGSKASSSKNTSRKSSGGKKAAESRSAAQKKLAERRARKRRLIGALVLAFLGVLSMLGYFNSDGVVVKLLRGLMTGLFGGGFYLLPPMLIVAAGFLALQRGPGVTLRVIAALSVPILVGGFCQIFSRTTYEGLTGQNISLLWSDGKALAGGGAVGGGLALGFSYLFSKAGAAIVLVCLSAAAVMCLLGMTLRSLIDMARDSRDARNERQLEAIMNEPQESEEERLRREETRRKLREQKDLQAQREAQARAQAKAQARARREAAAQTRSAIDIPMDEPVSSSSDTASSIDSGEPPVRKTSFFNKDPRKPAPDSLFRTAEPPNPEPVPEPEPPVQKAAETPPQPAQETSPAPEAQPEPKPEPQTVPVEVIPRPEPVEVPDSGPDILPQVRPQMKRPEPKPVRPAPFDRQAERPAARPAKPEKTDETKEAAAEIQSIIDESAKRDFDDGEYRFPPVSLLTEPVSRGSRDSDDELRATKDRLERCLRSFGVNVTISNIVHGPSITRYEMELEIGVKLNKLTNLADDIALALGVGGVRIAAIPNRISTVGIEVPNKNVSTVYLREIITAPEFQNAKSKLTFAIGKNISGDVMVGNISKLPHLLVAGTTGSGKSVCLNSLILSLMYKATPEEVKFIMIDPKMVEFKIYNGIPHLLIPVVTEAKKAAGALQWAVTEMMKRYRLFSDAGSRDLAGYNAQLPPEEPRIPQIVVIIDELADLMMIAAKEVEESICRVAQMGRAAGVHLVIATQSPRADVITGLMKANIPSRIALKVASSLESRIILDAGGAADKLVGNGDMLYAPIGASKPARIQGTWVSDEEREAVIEYVKQSGEASYSEDVIYEIERAAAEKDGGKQAPAQEDRRGDYDELLPQAADIIFETNQASVSMLQRRLKLGYARAARIVDQLEEVGVLGPFEGSKPRQIIMTRQQWQEMQFINGTAPIGPSVSDMPPMEAEQEGYDEEE